MEKPKRKQKQKIGNRPATTASYKRRFIAKIEKGYSARVAAQMCDIAHKTIYNWRNADPEFASDWDDAVEHSLDLVETRLMQRAIKHSDSNAQYILSRRRPQIYGKHDTSTNVTVRMTLEESRERLRQLGVPLPMIEGDCVDEDFTVPQAIEGDPIDE
jgi:putative ATPase subunit gpP of terminase